MNVYPFLSKQKLREMKFLSEAYSEPCQTSKIVRFTKIVNGFEQLTIFAKRSILDICQVSEYSSV